MLILGLISHYINTLFGISTKAVASAMAAEGETGDIPVVATNIHSVLDALFFAAVSSQLIRPMNQRTHPTTTDEICSGN
jgi:hypothetical protein